jgi:signal transduction histidine kinase
VVTGFRRFDAPLRLGVAPHAVRRLVLGPRDNFFAVEFAALDLVAPGRTRYAYRLEGFDPEWRAADRGRARADYTGVPPGTYTFRVRALDGAGGGGASAALAVVSTPPWWRTGWFAAAAAAALAAGAAAAWRLRERRLRAQFALVLAERTRVAGELHDTLLQGFTGIALQLRALPIEVERAPSAARAKLEAIVALAQRTLVDARHAVWDLRAPALDADDGAGGRAGLAGAVGAAARAAAARWEYRAAVRVLGTPGGLPAAAEGNLLRIAEEALANAGRHAAARAVAVGLRFAAGRVELTVEDDGRGFDPAAVRRGTGLRESIAGRLARLGGCAVVDARPGRGTSVRLRVDAPLAAPAPLLLPLRRAA